MCIICTEDIYDKIVDTLQVLNVSDCESLTSEKLQEILNKCKNLEELFCINCPCLTTLDVTNNKKLLKFACWNTQITSLNLQENKNLREILCVGCAKLISLKLNVNKFVYENYQGCPWICQNEEFLSNLQKLIRIQKWYKRMLIIKYMKSREFIEWFYNPNNTGGKCHKLKLLKEFI